MKSILTLAAVCAVVAFSGCQTNKAVSPGAVGECGKSCTDNPNCCKTKAGATDKTEAVSPGAVGEKKAGCCASKAGAAGKTETVAPGAVSDTKKSGCCSAAKAASGCTGKTTTETVSNDG